jgi:hypothetical protein
MAGRNNEDDERMFNMINTLMKEVEITVGQRPNLYYIPRYKERLNWLTEQLFVFQRSFVGPREFEDMGKRVKALKYWISTYYHVSEIIINGIPFQLEKDEMGGGYTIPTFRFPTYDIRDVEFCDEHLIVIGDKYIFEEDQLYQCKMINNQIHLVLYTWKMIE